jgi:hypothetical protein
VKELAPSRDHFDMQLAIDQIPGRENVTNAVIDMSGTYKNFITDFFSKCKDCSR